MASFTKTLDFSLRILVLISISLPSLSYVPLHLNILFSYSSIASARSLLGLSGLRWSKIARHLPGRTDNEIKNFWRTKIQKHIKQPENSVGQQSSDRNDSASSSTHVAALEEGTENYSSMYTGNLDPFPAPPPAPPESNENFWNMEDFWSMQLLNND